MPGPPPTPNVIKLLRGNPGKRRIADEPKPQIPETVPEPPPFLIGYAADEWYRVAPELHRLRLLTIADVMPFAAYCQAYMYWRTAAEALAAMASRDPVTNGLMVRGSAGSAMQNPLVHIARKAASDMVRYASEFGFTPAARARIAAGPFSDPCGRGGKFDGLLGG
jgi:P27 family predicted phage terminase small subunit